MNIIGNVPLVVVGVVGDPMGPVLLLLRLVRGEEGLVHLADLRVLCHAVVLLRLFELGRSEFVQFVPL